MLGDDSGNKIKSNYNNYNLLIINILYNIILLKLLHFLSFNFLKLHARCKIARFSKENPKKATIEKTIHFEQVVYPAKITPK